MTILTILWNISGKIHTMVVSQVTSYVLYLSLESHLQRFGLNTFYSNVEQQLHHVHIMTINDNKL